SGCWSCVLLSGPAKLANRRAPEAKRILYFTLMSAIDAGLIKTMEKCAPGHAPREPTVRADGRGVVGEAGAGAVQSVKYLELIPMFLNELQREHEARQQESAMLATLEAKLAA